MPDDGPRILAQASVKAGRYVIQARSNLLVADATSGRGGPGEAIGASELYLSSLATCGLALIGEAARSAGIDESAFVARASYAVDPSDGTRFEWVALAFDLPSVPDDRARELLDSFIRVCPIYNTVARDTRVDVTVNGLSKNP